jgi:hypothetical protein
LSRPSSETRQDPRLLTDPHQLRSRRQLAFTSTRVAAARIILKRASRAGIEFENGPEDPGWPRSERTSIGYRSSTQAELPHVARKSYCSPSRCSSNAPAREMRASCGASARPPPAALLAPAPPLNRLFWANASPPGCGRSRCLRPRRLPTLLSNSLPQCGSLASTLHLATDPILNLGCPAAVLSYILTIPRAGFLFTLASSFIRNPALFLFTFFYYGAGSFPRWLRGGFYLRTLFCSFYDSFCDHTSVVVVQHYCLATFL